jgi:hypothetical protein
MSGYPGKPLPAGSNPFADQVNPYASPQLAAGSPAAVPQKQHPFQGLWRQGNVLVMHKLAPLPDICVKSNQPAAKRLKRKLQWHHPAIAVTILAGLLVYVVLALVLTKRATIMLPLSDEWHERRKRRLIFGWIAGLLSLALMVAGIALAIQSSDAMWVVLFLVGICLGIFALIYCQYACAMVRPTRITDTYIWLKGVHPDYLNRLEVWQWNI